MKDIAAAGFTTVQTSPANECKDTYSNMKLMGNDEINGTDGCWWWQYQPTDWKIGNYQLVQEMISRRCVPRLTIMESRLLLT